MQRPEVTQPQMKVIDGVAYLSVGDAVALARQAHSNGYSAWALADAMATLARQVTTASKPPKKKEKTNVRRKR
jgi:hypothetical protein